MEYYFFLLSGLMLLDFLVFLVIARFYRYRSSAYTDIDGDTKQGNEDPDGNHVNTQF